MSVFGACYANGRLIVDCDHECMFNPKSDCNFCGMNTPEVKLRNIPDFKDYIERDYSGFPNYTIERWMASDDDLESTPNLIDGCDIFSTPVQNFLKNHGIGKDVAEQLEFLANYNENGSRCKQ